MTITEEKTLEQLLLKYDGAVPRYTSYPPANFFTEDPAVADCEELLRTSNHVGPRNISLYIHIPFCARRCLFCGCHTETGRPGVFIRQYLEMLQKEFRLLLSYLDRSRPVTQIHFGGGTPNFVPFANLEELMKCITGELHLDPSAEIAMECDPSLISLPRLEELRRVGFNRLSFGIQDVNPQVLGAVDRRPSRIAAEELVHICRSLGFTGINLDLIYGLPFQTRESFQKTVDAIIEADPDRVSLFPYAHVPWVKGHQAALQKFPMPDSMDRLRIGAESREAFLRAGYDAIGMDHFSKP
ncbi:MAG TPA: coproporphyrinogen III oxidase, partial [Fibrobacteres bacterium]|nr:coproporphyrinogen III oxidase [Fibrobacterota bacterium]